MSFNPPEGILDIGNATLRVGKLEVAETTGLNQGLQNIVKNDLLVTEKNESSPYTTKQTWGLKLPTAWVGEFEVKGQTGKYIEFNFYNEGSTSNAQGYTLNFEDTSLTLKYDNGNNLATATIPTIVGTFRKVNIFFERSVIAVSIDGIRYLYYKESDGFNNGLGVASRVVSATGGAFVNLFFESDHGGNSQFKNLRIVNGRFISDKTSNVSFIGSLGVGVNNPKESLDIRGNMHLTRVSNVSQVSVDSNVVTEYTGPHDRPLRKYPEVALTQNDESATSGYVASASSSLTASQPYINFDGNLASHWHSRYPYYSTSTGAYSPGTAGDGQSPSGTLATNELVSGHQGEWVSIELPKKIKLEKLKVIGSTRLATVYQFPKDVVVAVSETGLSGSWSALETATLISQNISNHSGTINITTQTSYYKYFALIIKSISTAGVHSAVEISELEFYGHEEGSGSLDTTLKTVYNVPATTGTQLEVYYDAKGESTVQSPIPDLSPNTNTGAVSGHSPTLDSTDGIDSFKFNGSSQYVTGAHGLTTGSDPVHTISLWLNATEMTDLDYVVQLGQGGTSHQQSAIIFKDNKISHAHWGSGVLSDVTLAKNVWYHVVAVFTGGNGSDLSKHKIFINGEDGGIGPFPDSSDGAVVLTGTQVTLGRNNYHGGSPGNYFNGSIANFRVYSKALNADQVKELYDYQKDYFLGSKSQVTLYKGHLGVGVTEPSGQLELAGDERIQEYPPGPMSDFETYIPEHGVFCAYSSSWSTNNNKPYPWKAFNKETSGDKWWFEHSHNNDYPYGASGVTTGYANSSVLAALGAITNGIAGHWIQLKLPYEIKLKSYALTARSTGLGHRMPENGIIFGSNDGHIWTQIHNHIDTGDAYVSSIGPRHFNVDSKSTYRYFRMATTKLFSSPNNGDTPNIGEIQFFGTPGPTTLDKGSLSLTRSLDVPRVSRYDVDTETPRPEKLVVDFDTTVNSSPIDISGTGNHGAFYSGASYYPADKAFNFSGWSGDTPAGTDDWIQTTATGTSGNFIHSVSMWVKSRIPSTSTTSRTPFHMGNAAVANQEMQIQFNYNGNGTVYLGTQGGWLTMSNMENVIKQNQWHHIAYTYNGTNMLPANTKFYIDGNQMTMGSGSSSQLSFPSGTEDIFIGRFNSSSSANWWNGQISNFKLYNVALEPSEVRKLYNLGRTGRSMVISDTAVGIGKAPEAQLDVRGSLAVRGDVEAYGKNFNMSPAGNLSILGSIYGASVTAPYLRSHYDRYGFDGVWRTLISTSAQDCGIGHLVNESGHQYAVFWFAHAGNGTGYVGWLQNGGYTNIAYSGSNIKVQGPVGTITRAYVLYLNNG